MGRWIPTSHLPTTALHLNLASHHVKRQLSLVELTQSLIYISKPAQSNALKALRELRSFLCTFRLFELRCGTRLLIIIMELRMPNIQTNDFLYISVSYDNPAAYYLQEV